MTSLAWKTVTFGEVVRLEQGLCFNKKTNHLMAEHGIPLLRIADLINGTETKFADEGRVPKKFISDPKDIIYSRTGQVGLVFRGRIGVVHNNCFRIIPKDGVERDFVYWYLRQPRIIETARSLASGAAQPDLGHDAFKSIIFRYPPPQTQRQLSRILSSYDDLIENNTRRIKILEQMAQMLYREWFVNFRFPGHEGVKMVESEMGLIPEGWAPSAVGKLCGEVRRSVNPSDIPTDTPYIGLEHMPRKSIALSEWGESGQVQSTKLRFLRGEILFGKIRPYFHKVGVTPVDGVCSSDAIVIVPKHTDFFSVVLLCVSSEDFVLQATQTSQGTKMPRANWNVLCKYPIALPPKDLLDRFGGTVVPMVELINNLSFRNRCLRSTRDLLLPKLVSGEIETPQVESVLEGVTV
jgi:type I restriction enzyme S subunit